MRSFSLHLPRNLTEMKTRLLKITGFILNSQPRRFILSFLHDERSILLSHIAFSAFIFIHIELHKSVPVDARIQIIGIFTDGLSTRSRRFEPTVEACESSKSLKGKDLFPIYNISLKSIDCHMD